MMIIIVGLIGASIFLHINGVFSEQLKAEKIRSRRSLPSNIEIYTLDHFISLVEKIERHKLTQEKPLKVIANYIRKLGYDSDKWTLLLGSQSGSLPDGILTPEENSVLTKMIKHGFVGQQEQGVVHTPFGDVAMGHVITGICAGISRNKAVLLQQIYQITSNHMDNLYVATVAGDLGLTALVNKVNPSTPLFGPGGTWSPNSQCPQTFNADMPSHSKATNAQILGGIDGFLMGHRLPSYWNKYRVRLGPLLRMYYDGGIVYDKQYAACKRMVTFREMVAEKELTAQVTLSGYAAKAAWNKDLDFSKVQNSDIAQLGKTTAQQFYAYIKNLPRGNSCPDVKDEGCSLPANIVFVLDESGSITYPNYRVEKDFVKKIIDAFEISSYRTRVAVVEYSDLPHVTIQLDDFSSKSTLTCAVNNLLYGGGGTATSKALLAAYDILKTAQSNAGPNHINDPQIMVLLTDGKSNSGQDGLKPIVESIKNNITGLTIVAVGIGNYLQSELDMIATDPNKHVFTTTDFSRLVTLVKSLRKQTCETSTVLQPIPSNDDKESGDEKQNNEVEVTGYLNPGKARYFTLPTETLFKTENISIQIKPSYGTVTLYGSRTNASPGPDNYDFRYQVDAILRQRRSTDTENGKTLEFYNVCKGYNATNCPPLYLSIYGENSTNSCSDRDCSVPSQIKFEITAAQIVKKQKTIEIIEVKHKITNIKSCFYRLSSETLLEIKRVEIKVSPLNDTVEMYTSRVNNKPGKSNHTEKIHAVAVGNSSLLRIDDPCSGYDKEPCPPLYLSFVGRELSCNCTADGRPGQERCTLPEDVTIKFIKGQPSTAVQITISTLLAITSILLSFTP